MRNIFKKMKVYGRVAVEAFKAGMELNQQRLFFPTPMEVGDVKFSFLENSAVLTLTGIPSWMPGVVTTKVTDSDGNHMVIVNEAFGEFPERVRKAALAHEAAHIKLGHLEENMFKIILSKFSTRLRIKGELQADRCAVEELGADPRDLAEVLRAIAKVQEETVGEVTDKTLERRIEALLEMVG